MTMTIAEIIRAIEPALNLFSAMQQRPGARFSVAVEREQLGKAISALHAMKAEGQQAVQAAVLAHLDGLLDDAAAHIYPSDLRKCQTSECTVTVASVRTGNREERSVPLFSREQVVDAFCAAIAAQTNQGGAA